MEIQVRDKCPYCNGTGLIQNPIWTAYWDCHKSRALNNDEEMEKWFRAQGAIVYYKGPQVTEVELFPDEEITCPGCEGTGVRYDWVDISIILKVERI